MSRKVRVDHLAEEIYEALPSESFGRMIALGSPFLKAMLAMITHKTKKAPKIPRH